MTSALSNKYRYSMFCQTEQQTVLTVLSAGSEPTAPTDCPNNASHTIAPGSVLLQHTVHGDQSLLDESNAIGLFTSGRYFAENYMMTISDTNVGSVTDLIVVKPFNICLSTATFEVHADNVNDQIQVQVNPEATVGLITSNIGPGVTAIPTSLVTLAQVRTGYFVSLEEGGTVNELGRVVGVDWLNWTVLVETPTTDSFTAGAGSLRISIGFCDIGLHDTGSLLLGGKTFGGSLIMKNTPVRIRYTNVTSGAKHMSVMVQYQY